MRVSKEWGILACVALHRKIILDGRMHSLGPFATKRENVSSHFLVVPSGVAIGRQLTLCSPQRDLRKPSVPRTGERSCKS
jgi:hypothetical protein